MKSQKLSVLEKIGYGSGDAAVNVVISSMFLIITFFYTDIFGIKPKDIALLFLLVRFIDAIRITSYNVCYTKLLRPFPGVASLVSDAARARSDGYLYGVVTYSIAMGRGLMPRYGDKVRGTDRWDVVNYVRRLQAQVAGGGPS